MHRQWTDDPATHCDHVHDPGRQGEWGGEYGPDQLTPYAAGIPGVVAKLYFMMSTWNPYNTVLMTAAVTAERVRLDQRGWLDPNTIATGPQSSSQRKFALLAALVDQDLSPRVVADHAERATFRPHDELRRASGPR